MNDLFSGLWGGATRGVKRGRLSAHLAPTGNDTQRISCAVAALLPGQGDTRHNPLSAGVIIAVLDGMGERILHDAKRRPDTHRARPETCASMRETRLHPPRNTDAQDMRNFVVYARTGPDTALRDLPDLCPKPARG